MSPATRRTCAGSWRTFGATWSSSSTCRVAANHGAADDRWREIRWPAWLIDLVLLFLFYLVAYGIVIFSNAAPVSRLGKIVLYALISATVGVIASSIASSGRDSGIVLGIVLVSAVALLTGAINGVFQASRYRYATTGDAGPFIRNEDAAASFQTEAPPA